MSVLEESRPSDIQGVNDFPPGKQNGLVARKTMGKLSHM